MDINGAEELGRLSKALKGMAGANGVQKEFNKALTKAVRPLKQKVKQSAGVTLPRRGGLAAAVAKSRVSSRRSNNSKGVGLRVTMKGPYSLDHLDRGIVRHPGGNDQHIRPGFWTDPTDAAAPEAQKGIEAAMAEVVKKIDRSV